MKCAGIDGCPGGWVVVVGRDLRSPTDLVLCQHFDEVIDRTKGFDVVAIDMPIGLLENARRGGRCCDQDARAILNASPELKAASRVFSPPIRRILEIADYRKACEVSRASSPAMLKISKQAHGLRMKLHEVDNLMTPERQKRYREAHPELAFQALRREVEANPVAAPLEGKKSEDGRRKRIDLLSVAMFENVEYALSPEGKRWPRSKVGRDDILDAAVLLWTAERIACGDAQRLPAGVEPPKDRHGLWMEIWF